MVITRCQHEVRHLDVYRIGFSTRPMLHQDPATSTHSCGKRSDFIKYRVPIGLRSLSHLRNHAPPSALPDRRCVSLLVHVNTSSLQTQREREIIELLESILRLVILTDECAQNYGAAQMKEYSDRREMRRLKRSSQSLLLCCRDHNSSFY